MTIESDIIQPVKDFVRDSKFLINRCTKPDKKGSVRDSFFIYRIHSNCYCHCYWLCCNGFCWLFCEVDSYPYQQYPHWCLKYFDLGENNWVLYCGYVLSSFLYQTDRYFLFFQYSHLSRNSQWLHWNSFRQGVKSPSRIPTMNVLIVLLIISLLTFFISTLYWIPLSMFSKRIAFGFTPYTSLKESIYLCHYFTMIYWLHSCL